VKFWDTSALVPLLADEPQTDAVRAIAESDPELAVSFITAIEVDSALWRKSKRSADEVARQRSHRRLAALEADWLVINSFDHVLHEARRIVRRRGLRAADALQLASAMLLRPAGVTTFVTLDHDLAAAARAEGFPILP
jgi:predicted nucleic acid-binding protein